MRIGLQKFLIMIGLDDERVHFAQSFDQHLGWITEIGDETEAAIAGVKGVTDGLDRIVRNGKILNENVADGELGTRAKNSPVFMGAEAEATSGVGRLRIAVNWNGKFPAKYFESTNMVAVLMGEKQAIELLRGHAALFEPDDDLARAQSAIDKNSAVTGGNEGAIPGAAAAEHCQAEHG